MKHSVDNVKNFQYNKARGEKKNDLQRTLYKSSS